MADCIFLWEDAGLEVPIDFDRYYIVAPEDCALTIAGRDTGQLLLFAQDHNFPDVTPLPGCPPYTLHTIDGLPDLASWLEACAVTWLDS